MQGLGHDDGVDTAVGERGGFGALDAELHAGAAWRLGDLFGAGVRGDHLGEVLREGHSGLTIAGGRVPATSVAGGHFREPLPEL